MAYIHPKDPVVSQSVSAGDVGLSGRREPRMRVQREREDAIDVRWGCISHSGDGHGGGARVHALRREPAAASGDGGILGAGDGVR